MLGEETDSVNLLRKCIMFNKLLENMPYKKQ